MNSARAIIARFDAQSLTVLRRFAILSSLNLVWSALVGG